MIIILFLFIIVVLLFVIAGGACSAAATAKRRYIEEHPAQYYRDAGIIRISWAIATLVVGFVFPPLWILTLFLFLFGFYCFDRSKKLREPQRGIEKSVTCYVAPRDIPRSNTFNAIRQ